MTKRVHAVSQQHIHLYLVSLWFTPKTYATYHCKIIEPYKEKIMPAQRFRKNPVEVEAIQWTGDNEAEIQQWQQTAKHFRNVVGFWAVDEEDRGDDPDITAEVYDYLHSTWVGVKTGQWIICGVKGEFYPIDEEVLRDTYTAIGGYVVETHDGTIVRDCIFPDSIEAFIRNNEDQ